MQTSSLANVQSQPLVSVMIRSMDREHLPNALASVAQQTYPHIEVLVAAAKPGHSPLASHCGAFPLRLVDTAHLLSRSQAANLALEHAQGQYLIFLDDDDWFMPHHIQRLVDVLHALPRTLAAYTGIDLVDAQGHPIGQLDHPFDRIRMLSGNLMPIHAVLFHRDLVQQGCRFNKDLDLFEDWDFWLQVSTKTSFAHLPESSAVYRVHESSGVHIPSDARDHAQNELVRKWLLQYPPEQLRALIRRVWLANDFERQCMQLQEENQLLNLDLANLKSHLHDEQHNWAELQSHLRHQLNASQGVAQKQRDALEQALHRSSRRYQAALRTIEKLQHQRIEHMGQKAEINTQINLLNQAVLSYEHSNSWKITAPLRWLSRVLRGRP